MKLNLAFIIFILCVLSLNASGQKKAGTKIPEFCSINSTLLSNGKFQVKIRWKPATDSSIIGYLLVNTMRRFKPDSLFIIGRNLPEQTLLISSDDPYYTCTGIKIFSIDSFQNKFTDNLKWTPVIRTCGLPLPSPMGGCNFMPIDSDDTRMYFYRFTDDGGKTYSYYQYWQLKKCEMASGAFNVASLPQGLYQVGTICNTCDSSYFSGFSWGKFQTSLTETNVSNNFQVFPNPVTNRLFVSLGENLKGKELSFELLLPNGQVVETFQIDDSHTFYDFDDSKQLANLYFLHLIGSAEYRKILVQPK
jgi:hypothetical protein